MVTAIAVVVLVGVSKTAGDVHLDKPILYDSTNLYTFYAGLTLESPPQAGPTHSFYWSSSVNRRGEEPAAIGPD